jgi:hypothetical protein
MTDAFGVAASVILVGLNHNMAQSMSFGVNNYCSLCFQFSLIKSSKISVVNIMVGVNTKYGMPLKQFNESCFPVHPMTYKSHAPNLVYL